MGNQSGPNFVPGVLETLADDRGRVGRDTLIELAVVLLVVAFAVGVFEVVVRLLLIAKGM